MRELFGELSRGLLRAWRRQAAAVLWLPLLGLLPMQVGAGSGTEEFGCIRDMTPVGRFYVDNPGGPEALAATVAVAGSKTGGVFPAGSVVQLVPTEVMVKREAGFSPETGDWEFFELAVSKEGTDITVRGTKDVVNRFGGNCLECHAKAEPQWDLICSTDHGCDPIPLTDTMIVALQKADPRCAPVAMTEEEKQVVKALSEL